MVRKYWHHSGGKSGLLPYRIGLQNETDDWLLVRTRKGSVSLTRRCYVRQLVQIPAGCVTLDKSFEHQLLHPVWVLTLPWSSLLYEMNKRGAAHDVTGTVPGPEMELDKYDFSVQLLKFCRSKKTGRTSMSISPMRIHSTVSSRHPKLTCHSINASSWPKLISTE